MSCNPENMGKKTPRKGFRVFSYKLPSLEYPKDKYSRKMSDVSLLRKAYEQGCEDTLKSVVELGDSRFGKDVWWTNFKKEILKLK